MTHHDSLDFGQAVDHVEQQHNVREDEQASLHRLASAAQPQHRDER